jgi:hypothetical protein
VPSAPDIARFVRAFVVLLHLPLRSLLITGEYSQLTD